MSGVDKRSVTRHPPPVAGRGVGGGYTLTPAFQMYYWSSGGGGGSRVVLPAKHDQNRVAESQSEFVRHAWLQETSIERHKET